MIDYPGQGIEADVVAEEKFYQKDFQFSYSSINKLLFSPKLFYTSYILKQREERLDAHLVEGKLVHTFFLEGEDKVAENYLMLPTKLPSGNNKIVVDNLYFTYGDLYDTLEDCKDEIIQLLEEMNLHQKLKTDQQRLDKILTEDNETYFEFLLAKERGQDVIDQDTYDKCKAISDQMTINKEVRKVFRLDEDVKGYYPELPIDISKWNEHYDWGLKGYLDCVIELEDKFVINDVKTTAKDLANFSDTVEYYKYWLQAVIYVTLVREHFKVDEVKPIEFNFCVTDKYQQIKCFNVETRTLKYWNERFLEEAIKVNWHYSNRNYMLPYDVMFSNRLNDIPR